MNFDNLYEKTGRPTGHQKSITKITNRLGSPVGV